MGETVIRHCDFLDARLPLNFWDKVSPCPMTGCWLWTAALNNNGYACYAHKDGRRYGHRVAYQTLVGPIPRGLELDHLCRVTCCVNPLHLEPVTHQENLRRGAFASRPSCPHGHPYEGDNVYIRPDTGTKMCRTCYLARSRLRSKTHPRRSH